MSDPKSARPAIQILVVDDEPAIRSLLRSGFEHEGYVVWEASDRATLLACLAKSPISLVTLDLDLRGEDGLPLAREVRSLRNVPIIMITGKGHPVDRVVGLEQGADDYIVKPFYFKEVLLRVRKVLDAYGVAKERSDGAAHPGSEGNSGNGKFSEARAEQYQFETGTVNVARRLVIGRDGGPIDLTAAEFNLLVIFLRQPVRILSRDEIALQLNGRAWSPEDRSIDGHIARLRRKIDFEGDSPRLIKSVRGIGYVFTGSVQRLD